MDQPMPAIDEIFAQAIRIDSSAERGAYLDKACQNDVKLRQRLERLIDVHLKASSEFLEAPATGLLSRLDADLGQTIDVDPAALEAGLVAPFQSNAAVVVGGKNHSVLKSLGKQLSQVPNVTLRATPDEASQGVNTSSGQVSDAGNGSRYELHGEIARGGMGAIIKGRDADLGRELAIKVLLDSHKAHPEIIQRFVEEAQIGGQLQHPGIVPVYELGQFDDQRPFFTMKLVKGETLAAILAKRESPSDDIPKLLGIFEQICQTMAYAHSKGVIHRDLKPANIMVGAFGEVQVMDWGLSKVLVSEGEADAQKASDKQRDVSVIQTRRSAGSDAPGNLNSGSGGSDTRHGSVMGTPAYMPPEQALGHIQALDERADVFGLGAILAEILTGKPAYSADNADKVYRMATQGRLDACFARLAASGAEPELIAIARLALAAEPDDRTRNAGELSESITHHLESVQERLKQAELARVKAQTRTEEERRRKKLYVAMASMALSAAIGSVFVTIWFMNISEQNQQLAGRATAAQQSAEILAEEQRELRERADGLLEENRRALYESDVNIAYQSFRDGNHNGALELLANWLPTSAEVDYRGTEWHYLASVANDSEQERLPYGDDIPWPSFCFSNDEAILALVDNNTILKLIDFQAEREIFRLDGRDLGLTELRVGRFSPDGGLLVLGSNDGVKILDTRTHDVRTLFEGESTSFTTVSNDGRWAACTLGGDIVVWDLATDEMKWRKHSGYDDKCRIQFSPNSELLGVAVSGVSKVIQIWDVETATRLKEHWASQESYVKHTDFTFLDNESVLCFGPYLSLFQVDDTHQETRTVPDCFLPTYLASSPDGRRVAISSADLSVHIFDSHSGKLIWRKPFENFPGKVRFMAGSEHVVVLSGNSLFKCDLTKYPGASQLPQNFAYHWHDGVAATRDTVFAEGGTEVGEVISWDPIQTEPKQRFRIPQDDATIVVSMEASNDGSLLAVGYIDVVRTWDTKSGEMLLKIDHLEGSSEPMNIVYSVAFSPDNQLIAGGLRYKAALWDRDGKLIWSRIGYHVKILFSPDNKLMFVANGQWEGEEAQGKLHPNFTIWDIQSGTPRLVKQFRQNRTTHNIAASRDGRWLACAVGNELVIYDVMRLAVHKTFPGNRRISPTMDFSPDGNVLAAGSDNRIRVWNVETSKECFRIDVEGEVFGVRFVESTTKGLGLFVQSQESESKSGLRVQWIKDPSTDWTWLAKHRRE